jgi:two-component system LytT family sensor kinase
VDPAVADATMPSLLLQPLVENAVKYAVTPKEEGADITVSAKRIGNRVHIEVSDTGPGSNLTEAMARATVSTGVGLANIRDRLTQAYGADHRFDIQAGEGGFAVAIEIPYQAA